MKITYAPKGILQIDDARIIFRNFTGVGSKYNREGDKNFALIIDNEEDANKLFEIGWNVKIRAPKEEGDSPFMYMPVKIKFNDYGPNIYLQSGKRKIKLDEDTVSSLDNIDIDTIDMDIRPYYWEVNGKSGVTAYLQTMFVVQKVDRFRDRFEDDFPCE